MIKFRDLLHIGTIVGAIALAYQLGCAINKPTIDYDIGLGKEITATRIENSCYIKCKNSTIKDYEGKVFNCSDLTFIVNGREIKSFEEFACPEKLNVKVEKSLIETLKNR